MNDAWICFKQRVRPRNLFRRIIREHHTLSRVHLGSGAGAAEQVPHTARPPGRAARDSGLCLVEVGVPKTERASWQIRTMGSPLLAGWRDLLQSATTATKPRFGESSEA